METVKLRNGIVMPILGYGTFQLDVKDVRDCVLGAFNEGYRLIDTASSYLNEEEIKKTIMDSKIPREELFITTKVWVQDAGYENTLRAFETSLKNLGLDYLDLYLIHQPLGDYYGSWRAMEKLYQEGKVKAIGVSNFSTERLVDLCMNCSIKPMIDQVECHPFLQQKELRCVASQYGCQIQAWGPLCEGQKDIFNHPILVDIAKKHHKTVAQVILRWQIENQVIVIPKTKQRTRMKENMNIWDFRLDKEDQEAIEKMDLGYSEIINHQCYTTAKWLNLYKIHD